jgi:CheY-like chemotaxis protein
MNNVLGAVLGLASLQASQAPDGSAMRKRMETIVTACHRGANLVKGLLGFARQGLTEEKILNLNTLVKEEVALLERTTLQRVRLVADLAEDLMPVKGDPGALSHALMNLCVNAVDAMAAGGTLTIRTRNEGDESVLLEVVDTGSGMPKETLERAMDPFFTTKPHGKGTGLGLSIVYGTVKAHHGKIEIQSQPGEGTRIAIHLPAGMFVASEADPAAEVRPRQFQRALKVLLVDDDELIQSSMQAILEVLGHDTTITASGEEALAKLETGFQPDVVILDMNMPGLGGAGTLPRLRALNPTVPVLLATGRADQSAMNLIQTNLGVALLSKPYELKDLEYELKCLG